MKFHIITLAFLVFSNSADAFVGVGKNAARFSSSVRRDSRHATTSLRMSESEVEKLRAAAAKAREEADRLAKELGRPEAGPSAVATKKAKKLSKDQLMSTLEPIPFDSNDVEAQSTQLGDLREDGKISLYRSANLRTYPVSLGMLESRTRLDIAALGLGGEGDVNLDDFKYATLGVVLGSGVLGILSLAVLPPNIGATLCYFFALIPVLFLGLGSTAPGAIAEVIAKIKNGNDDGSDGQVTTKDRKARHEAAHFMCGYLCGLPIIGYNVVEDGGGVSRVEFSAGSQSFSKEQVASLSITAMSGLVAEAMEYGSVKGAENDLLELQQIFRRSQEFIGAQQQQDLTRWGALTAFNLLSENKKKLEELEQAFKQKKSVVECISILEC